MRHLSRPVESKLCIAGAKTAKPKLVVLINLPQITHGGDLSRCILTGGDKITEQLR